jgi:hypothetical protein
MTDIDILLEFLCIDLAASDGVFERFSDIPDAIVRGSGMDKFLYVRGSRPDRVLLVAHADTYWDNSYGQNHNAPKELSIDNGIIRNLNGGLGADDRAGCAILWLLKDLGHSILITNGEEGGLVGSRWLRNENPDIFDEINSTHQFAVQFDRRNSSDYKCYSVGTAAFRDYIGKMTGYSEPDRKSSTDIVILSDRIAGVNLSIGYRKEHTEMEHLVMDDWQHTLDICRSWLSENDLPRFPLTDDKS